MSDLLSATPSLPVSLVHWWLVTHSPRPCLIVGGPGSESGVMHFTHLHVVCICDAACCVLRASVASPPAEASSPSAPFNFRVATYRWMRVYDALSPRCSLQYLTTVFLLFLSTRGFRRQDPQRLLDLCYARRTDGLDRMTDATDKVRTASHFLFHGRTSLILSYGRNHVVVEARWACAEQIPHIIKPTKREARYVYSRRAFLHTGRPMFAIDFIQSISTSARRLESAIISSVVFHDPSPPTDDRCRCLRSLCIIHHASCSSPRLAR